MLKLLIFVILFNCSNLTPVPVNDSLDWRTRGAVLPVPNLGPCSSIIVVNALDSISAAHQIKTEKLVQLSQQQIYDCGKIECPDCTGSPLSVTDVYDSIFESGVSSQIDSESSYPSTGKCTKKCNFKKSGAVTTLSGYMFSNKSDENSLLDLIKKGPVTVDIEVNSSFELYSGGIFDDSNCKGDILNHNLILVGYGTERGVNYWIARNSWGTSWGENGYIRIVRDKNMCGIANMFVQPFVSE